MDEGRKKEGSKQKKIQKAIDVIIAWKIKGVWIVSEKEEERRNESKNVFAYRLCSFALASHSAMSSILLACNATLASEISNMSPMSELYITSN